MRRDWIVASAIGGSAANGVTRLALELSPGGESAWLLLLPYGLLFAVPQWVLLRGELARAGWWLPITAMAVLAGWLVAFAALVALGLAPIAVDLPAELLLLAIVALAAVTTGVLGGTWQAAFFHARGRPVRAWLPASVAGALLFAPAAFALFVSGLDGEWLVLASGAVCGGCYGAVTGRALARS